jgi:DNA-binding response OmpR family regulator
VAASESNDREIGPSVCISISDTGSGIQPEDRVRIFEMFTQLDDFKTRPASGTGLGLYIVSRFVRMLHGRIDMSSEFGKGSTFTVTLPIEQEDAPRGDVSPECNDVVVRHREASGEEGDPRGIGLLCIDDDPKILASMQFAFRDAGYEVLLVEDYDTAIEQPWRHQPDIVLLELGVPAKDAFVMLRTLQRGPALSRVPVVIMPVARDEARDVQAAAHLFLLDDSSEHGFADAMRSALSSEHSSVLVVNEGLRRVHAVADSLTELGLPARLASSGQDAIQRLRTAGTDAVLLSLDLPEREIRGLLEQLGRLSVERPATALLLVTSDIGRRDITELARDAGALMSGGEANTVALVNTLMNLPSYRACSLKEISS